MRVPAKITVTCLIVASLLMFEICDYIVSYPRA